MKIFRKASLILLSAAIFLSGCGSSGDSNSETNGGESEKKNTNQSQQSSEEQEKGNIDLNFKENIPSGEEFEEAEVQTEKYLEEKYGKDFVITSFETHYEFDKNNIQQFEEFVGSAIIAFDEEDLDIVFPIRVDKHGNVTDEYYASLPQGTVYQNIEKEVQNIFGSDAILVGEAKIIASDAVVTATDIDIYIPTSQVNTNEEAANIEKFNEYLIDEQYADEATIHIYYVTQGFLEQYMSEDNKEQLSKTDVLIPLIEGEEVEGVESYVAYDIDYNQTVLEKKEIAEELSQGL